MMHTPIAKFVSYLNSLDVQLFIEGDRDSLEQIRLRCTAPVGTLTTDLCQELTARKAELISYLHQDERKDRNSRDDQEHQDSENILLTPNNSFPLSFAQQRLWFLYQLAPDNPFYNIPAAIRLTGTLNQTALEQAFNQIIDRHAALRTTFTAVAEQPVQTIQSNIKVELPVVNLSSVAHSERERVIQQLATTEAQHPFNLTTDLLLRLTLLQFTPTDAVLLLTLHHIVADGWSLGVLIRELAYFYTAFVEGRSPELPPLPIQYPDFANWQREWLQGEVLEQQLAYWRQQLQNLPRLQLPSDRPRPSVQTYRGATYPLQISSTLTQALEHLSQQAGTSLFMTLLAAFQTLLHRYTGQDDIAIGSPIANRHRSEVEGLIGFFVNSLVLRTDLAGDPPFRELLKRVRNTALEAYEYQDLPFEKLVEALDPDRDLSHNPLFQVAFALQNAPMQPLELPGLRLDPAPLESSSTRFDLEVHLWEPAHGLQSFWQSQAGLSGFISYSTDLFDRERIGRLIGHFQTLLTGIIANPDARLSELPLLPPTEHQQIVVEWPRSSLSDLTQDNGLCFHHIFEAQAQLAPDAIALISEQGSLTYKELNQKADDLAQTLRQMNVQPNQLVGLYVDRSADMIIGILGIFKSGGAYVPLDPNHPRDRLHFMLTDTQVAILLTQSWLVTSLPATSAHIICLDQSLPLPREPLQADLLASHSGATEAPQLLNYPKILHSASLAPQFQGELRIQRPPELGDLGGTENTVTPDSLAYVIYTSGSTGIPKGVLLTHRGLCNVVAAQQQVFHLSNQSRILQFSSLSFDASIFEMALALGCGGTLYIPPQSAQLPGMALIQFLQANAITHALITPSVLAVLPTAELPALNVLITGGEVCSSQVIDRWAPDRHFFNAYGPTETTIWATVAELYAGDNPLSIGRPILNTQIYILDPHLNPVPVGIPGELYIGGVGLAQGYLNRSDLTAERFIANPFVNQENSSTHTSPISSSPLSSPPRLYKTGDRAQYHPDGTIEFLGRADEQIKIRGFRVELGEIEARLQQHPAIQDAVVISSDETSNQKRLISYFSLDRQYCQQAIIPALQQQHLQQWQDLYQQTYQQAIQPSTFNTTGWHSSYTGAPIPPEEMQEWVSDRVQQILALKPQRVLEIGCGTGLLLWQIAPHCQNYVGTDFSAVSLEAIQQQLNLHHLTHIELQHRMATDFEGLAPASFDVVILNSIVQYFPSQDYLMQVLAGAMHVVRPSGVVFVGDVRSLPLLAAFHSWVNFSQAGASVERAELQQQVERSQFEEPELAIDPAFFYALPDRFPQLQQVMIRLSRGHSHNEMTQFRYNVLLHTEPAQMADELPQPLNEYYHDWKLQPVTVLEAQKYLIEHAPDRLVITHVTNSRVNAAIKTANWLHHKTTPKTVGQMRAILQNLVEPSIDPQNWWDLETQFSYTVEITWSMLTDTGDYDVQMIRQGSEAKVNSAIERKPHQFHSYYTNEPLQASVARQLMPEIRQYLRQTLPDYMIPSTLVPLATIPLTVNGKVDRLSLTKRTISALNQTSDSPISTSLTPTETTLIEIWQDLLRLKQVNIHDNFFELGGHSLLATQMTSRVRDSFGLELPLKSVFAAPTIAQIAPILDLLGDTTSAPVVPPLVRLDRAAYRRSRSQSTNGNLHIPPISATSPSDQVSQPEHQVTMKRSPLVPLTLGGDKAPFFCVHPMFGVVFPYLELAHHLDNDRSFYGLQPLGLDGKSTPLNEIEAIAAYYIQAMQTLQPQGPYFLGGWSFGGLVAFEMAQQLTQLGEAVACLAILDTPAPSHKLSFCQSLKFLLGTALWSTLPFLLHYGDLASQRWQVHHSWLARWQWSALGRLISEESRLQLFDESAIRSILPIVYANSQAAYRYLPKPYSGQITLFKAAEQPDAYRDDPTLGWSALVNDIQLHEVPGNHLSLLQPPQVQTLAQQLKTCFARAENK